MELDVSKELYLHHLVPLLQHLIAFVVEHQLFKKTWLQWFQHSLWSSLVTFTYNDKTCVCVCAQQKHCICRRASFQTLRKKQHRLRVIRETKTRVSTSGDRGGGAQAVKFWEVLFGRTVGSTEQVKATWKGTTHITYTKAHKKWTHTHTDRNRQQKYEWMWVF